MPGMYGNAVPLAFGYGAPVESKSSPGSGFLCAEALKAASISPVMIAIRFISSPLTELKIALSCAR